MQSNVAVLGSEDFVMPFSALGLDTYAVGEEAESVLEKAQAVVGAEYSLVVVAENIAKAVEQVFEARRNEPVPCVIVVPFTTEPTGLATETLGAVLKTATGINILQNR